MLEQYTLVNLLIPRLAKAVNHLARKLLIEPQLFFYTLKALEVFEILLQLTKFPLSLFKKHLRYLCRYAHVLFDHLAVFPF